MNKKKIVVISGIVLSFLVIIVVIIMSTKKDKVAIFFDTDGGIRVSRMTVNVGEKVKLPTTTRKGYTFDGWYDEDTKVGDKASFKKETTLTAHWIESEVKTMTISFNVVGGNKIEEMTIECDKEFKLPIPTKEGYKFINWTDKKGTIIANETKLTCEDITLKAKWEKDEVKKEETKKEETKKEEVKKETKEEVIQETKEEKKEEVTEEVKKEYTCPDGYTLDSDKCKIEESAKTKCSDGTEVDGKCLIIDTDSKKDYELSCNNGGELIENYCYLDEVELEEGTTCENEINNKCYSNKEEANKTCSEGYTNISDGCFIVTESVKEQYCSEEFVLENNKCIKTIEATLK